MSKKLSVIIGAVVVLLLAVWFGGSWYASNTAKDKLEEFVYGNGLQKVVHWDDVSASLFGSTTVSNLNIDLGGIVYNIEKLEIHDFVDDYDRKLFDISLHGLANQDGVAPSFISNELSFVLGAVKLAPADINFKVDIDYADNDGMLDFDVEVPDVGSLSGGMNIKDVRAVRSAVEDMQRKNTKKGGFPSIGKLNDAINDIRFLDGELSFKENGFIKRGLALYQRYSVVPLPDKDLDDMRKQATKELALQIKETCMMRAPIADKKSACENIAEFLTAEKSSLSIKAKARAFTSVEDIQTAIEKYLSFASKDEYRQSQNTWGFVEASPEEEEVDLSSLEITID